MNKAWRLKCCTALSISVASGNGSWPAMGLRWRPEGWGSKGLALLQVARQAVQADGLRRQVQDAQRQHRAAEQSITSLQQELKAVQGQAEAAEASAQQLQRSLTAQMGAEAQQSHLQQQLAMVQQAASEREQHAVALQQKLAGAQQEAGEAERRATALQQRLAAAQEEQAALHRQVTDVRVQLRSREQEQEHLQVCASLNLLRQARLDIVASCWNRSTCRWVQQNPQVCTDKWVPLTKP